MIHAIVYSESDESGFELCRTLLLVREPDFEFRDDSPSKKMT